MDVAFTPSGSPTPPKSGVWTRRSPGGLLAGLKIRKKLIFLHTSFSVFLAVLLLIALRPALRDVVRSAEQAHAAELIEHPRPRADSNTSVRSGTAAQLGLSPAVLQRLGEPADGPRFTQSATGATVAVVRTGEGRYRLAEVVLPRARAAVGRAFGLVVLALLAVYALVAAALEVFVLPQNVYGPIRRMLLADRAVQLGDREHELVDESAIPRDELGQIMRSRNASIRLLRQKETELADALERIESVAGDLKRKNHLLENARRNLEGADRLASLGTMSAGIAHELNTPLTVAKGLAEKLRTGSLSEREAGLLHRVVGRLERLSESLLDYSRAREPHYREADLRRIVDEAITLVTLDRDVDPDSVRNDVPEGTLLPCDQDRLVQVFVNLVRNAVDACVSARLRSRVRVDAERVERDRQGWIAARVRDRGPGIDPGVLPDLFEPFVSSRLDAKGTGLGLAVADSIVREHAGTIIAGNRTDGDGAVFEVLLPLAARDSEEPPPRSHGGEEPAHAVEADTGRESTRPEGVWRQDEQA
mgnify:CR=1 FL=1